MPNPALFPFKSFSMGLEDGSTLNLSAADVNAALQYSPTPGLPELVRRLLRLQIAEHGLEARAPPVTLAVTPGSQVGPCGCRLCFAAV